MGGGSRRSPREAERRASLQALMRDLRLCDGQSSGTFSFPEELANNLRPSGDANGI